MCKNGYSMRVWVTKAKYDICIVVTTNFDKVYIFRHYIIHEKSKLAIQYCKLYVT